MKSFKMLVLASTFIAGSIAVASAQSANQPAPGASGSSMSNVSAATHCREANGQIRLKSAMQGGSGSTTGAASTGTRDAGSAGASSADAGTASPQTGTSPSNMAASLSPC